jgi:hypothetical protein
MLVVLFLFYPLQVTCRQMFLQSMNMILYLLEEPPLDEAIKLSATYFDDEK